MLKKLIIGLVMISSLWSSEQESTRWVVYYADEAPPSTFKPYSLIVFDSDEYPHLQMLREEKKMILGYISLGEVEEYRSYFKEVKKEGILFEENPNWPGSYFVDLRDPRWGKRVVEELIPKILTRKFDGLLIDTIDNAEYMEYINPEKYKGMVQAAVDLLGAIRMHFPDIQIMLNRGYAVLPKAAKWIDMIMAESLYTDYDFESKTYKKVPEELFNEQMVILRELKRLNPHLKMFSLDYWDPEDKQMVKEIYEEERKNGFSPYVATIDLDKVIPEP